MASRSTVTDDVECCPYLDAGDARCGEHMSVDDLAHAFHYCFGEFLSCDVFKDKFIRRRSPADRAAGGSRGDSNGARNDRPRVVVQVYVKRTDGRVPVESI